jgi:superfamily I DNA/RNA helicase
MALSHEQRSALWNDLEPLQGMRSLSARPGTGKTTTVAQYCLDLAADWRRRREPWQGMAVLSYTNVAKDEVEDRIRQTGTAHILLRHPHFVGTLDTFVNQHIFLPHGAAPMAYTGGRPTLVGEPFHQWQAPWTLHRSSPADAYKPMFFDCYTIGVDDRPLRIDETPRAIGSGRARPAQAVSPKNGNKIRALKRHVWSHGMALQTDANYLAYQALLVRPLLATALAERFPLLVIDEAQDMTRVQHAIIDLLVNAGLAHVVLVGDENQAIYEWNTARPDLFTSRATTNGWQTATLAESYRCSPAICATLTSMAADSVTLVPASTAKNAHYSAPVEVRVFERPEEAAAVKSAIESVAEALVEAQPHDGNTEGIKTVAVISRAAEDARRLQAQYNDMPTEGSDRTVYDSPLTRDFLRTVYHLGRGESDKAVRAYEALLKRAGEHVTTQQARSAVMRERSIAATDTVGYRVLIFADLKRLAAAIPDKQANISDCSGLCDLPLDALDRRHLQVIRRDCARLADPANASQNRLLSSLFAAREERTWHTHPDHPDIRILFATAHAVKGETYDAVVLHTKHRLHACRCPQSAGTWSAVLRHSMLQCETKRIAYVACSRAAQNLLILTPVESLNAWRSLATPAISTSASEGGPAPHQRLAPLW